MAKEGRKAESLGFRQIQVSRFGSTSFRLYNLGTVS